ncbi:hypothetical protein O7606_13015 [Micromonospora sp. WMMD882]|uniref:hypothetical protein n=1 Tax=Micromonospora sp. WMMD882 TaxID=3015151 RepID=UPI00248C54D8|nr:hypothetical protein [Micromonospora sp. WMMD882]WBB82199.1 hypothetical protein O7606_13015 [Micromonospora sp. WMMD882]
MVEVGAVAFGFVLGWWLGSRTGRLAATWPGLALLVAAGLVVQANTGPSGLPWAALGLLTGVGAVVSFRWAVRSAGS